MKQSLLLKISWSIPIAQTGLIFYYWNRLPEQIPTHFNAKGIPDAYSSASSIWFFPIITLGLILLFAWFNKHMLKINVNKLGSRNNEELAITRSMMATLLLFIVVLFFGILYGSILISLESIKSLSPWLIPIIVGGIVVILFWYFAHLFRLKK